MCGITGQINLNGEAVLQERTQASLDRILHRGPDSHDLVHFEGASFGHARLSVIDTSAAGSQPMVDPSGRYVLVFNGEIYNFKELAKPLVQDGVVFRTATDTEVLLHLLIREGKSCLEKLNGFFAFAFYDSLDKSGFIARDRIGIKPLYYHLDNKQLQFCSELKSLMAYEIPKELDSQALNYYFQLNYIPAPLSAIKNVRKLLPGQLLEFGGGHATTQVYYQLPSGEQSEHQNYEESKRELRELLADSVRKRMISDVPLGCFLSGGVDSSIISALASKESKDLRTFSIGYADNPFYDETHHAEAAASHLGTKHKTFKLSHARILEQLPKVLGCLDEPFADSSAIAVNILAEYTRQEVTVALSGDGADELFAGYNKHAAEFMMRNGGFRNQLIGAGAPLWSAMPQSRSSKWGNLFRKLSKYAEGVRMTPAERYWSWASFLSAQKTDLLLHEEHRVGPDQLKHDFTSMINGGANMNDFLRADCTLVLPNDMLTKVDRMSMAHALEVRTPFLDHRMVELAMQIPSEFKVGKNDRKKILKESFDTLLPSGFFNRSKQGFEVPLSSWMNNELSRSISERYLNQDHVKAKRLLSTEATEHLKLRLKSKSPGDAHMTMWAVIVLDHWTEDLLT